MSSKKLDKTSMEPIPSATAVIMTQFPGYALDGRQRPSACAEVRMIESEEQYHWKKRLQIQWRRLTRYVGKRIRVHGTENSRKTPVGTAEGTAVGTGEGTAVGIVEHHSSVGDAV